MFGRRGRRVGSSFASSERFHHTGGEEEVVRETLKV